MKRELKKKIDPLDMKIMLATEKQRSGERKTTQFTYYGNDVDGKKLDRARRNPKFTTTAVNGEYRVKNFSLVILNAR
jgi:hypothetical protein